MDSWITDVHPTPRFPLYTRGNAEEVGPRPISPLGWTLVFERSLVPGAADAWVELGVLSEDERKHDLYSMASFGGYLYNSMSASRLFGARMPGGDVEALDRLAFGNRPDTPPYEPDPEDVNEEQTAKIGAKLAWFMSTTTHPGVDAAAAAAARVRAARPDLRALSDAELIAAARARIPDLHKTWTAYMEASVASSVGPAAVHQICAGIARPDIVFPLISALGDVVSADASLRLWQLSRLVHDSRALTDAFDEGVDGLIDRLTNVTDPDALRFLVSFAELITAHGHRGPNEWDIASPSWETRPTLALSMLERMRHQSDDRSPAAAASRAAARREALTAEVTESLAVSPETQATFVAAVHSAGVFLTERERGKNALILLIHEAKLAMRELGRRHAEEDVVDDPTHVFMLLESELDDYLSDPRAFRHELARRSTGLAMLAALEPPYFIDVRKGMPAISTWQKRKDGKPPAEAAAGETLAGSPGAPGEAVGRARIVHDPAHAGAIEPGDILVTESTDPSWTPLFLSVAGVVTTGGALISHAAIVCREIGVPCVISCGDATDRIRDGATISIDGSTGTVRILEPRGQ